MSLPLSLAPGPLRLPALVFGAGPVSMLMTDAAARERQLATIHRALALGLAWFDTAATYGQGASETNLGWALRELGAASAARLATPRSASPLSNSATCPGPCAPPWRGACNGSA